MSTTDLVLNTATSFSIFFFHVTRAIKKPKQGTGGKIQRLKELAALLELLSSIPSNYKVAGNHLKVRMQIEHTYT